MTKAIPLESRIEKFANSLIERESYGFGDIRHGISDVRVMMKLGCTPQSWSRVRPLLIQYLQLNNLIIIENRDGVKVEVLNITIRYDKKNKYWYGRKNALHLVDKSNSNCYRQMTPEELEKYKIFWYVMDDFEY